MSSNIPEERTHKKWITDQRARGGAPKRATHERTQDRKDRASEREVDALLRTPEEQLKRLIERGHPNCREALKLAKAIANGETQPAKEEVTA